MSSAVIYDTHTFLPTPQFPDSPLSFLMIFLFHTVVTVQKNLSRTDSFVFPFFRNETYSYHFKEDNLSSLNLSHELTSIANSELCYVPASNDMLVSV